MWVGGLAGVTVEPMTIEGIVLIAIISAVCGGLILFGVIRAAVLGALRQHEIDVQKAALAERAHQVFGEPAP